MAVRFRQVRQLPDQSRALCRFDPLLDGNRKQRLSETEFVAVGVNLVEEALTPFGIARAQ
jgi:hypothetical protein